MGYYVYELWWQYHAVGLDYTVETQLKEKYMDFCIVTLRWARQQSINRNINFLRKNVICYYIIYET
jgi:hypothetical protein